tara:strand:+ start:1034 stop:1375 length:342 start_codon:yes stop_codon:yes gene_type:complete
MVQIDSTATSTIVLKLDGYSSGAVSLEFTNQLTEKVTTLSLTPTVNNDRYQQFSYPVQTPALIEGMYMLKFYSGGTTFAERLCYVSDGTTPLSESSYTVYTTGDSDNDYVYIP